MELYDLIIIGAGPAGLAAAIYAQERKLKLLVLEAMQAGGQLTSLYSDKPIYDFVSYPSIKAKDLAEKMITHATSYGVALVIGKAVTSVKKDGDHFTLLVRDTRYTTKAVLLATGMGHFRPRRLGVPGEAELTDKGVLYQSLPERVTGKRIVVIGGGDTALETAVAAAEKGAAVTIVHRKDTFRAIEQTVEKVTSLGIQVHFMSTVTEIHGQEQIEAVEILKGSAGRSRLTADYVIICIGMEIDRSFHERIGLTLKNQAVVVDENMQTSVPGIFACGDVVIPSGKYKRISVAVGSAATAINGIYQFLKNPYWKT